MTSSGVKKAVQARSRRTRDSLLFALEELLKEKEFSDIGVKEIAERAGVAAGSVYRRYDKKAGFIPALFELYHRRIEDWETQNAEAIAAALGPGPDDLRGFVRLRVDLAFRVLRDLGHLARPVHLYARLKPQYLPEETREWMAAAGRRLAEGLSAYRGEIEHDDLHAAAVWVLYLEQAVLADFALFADPAVFPEGRPSENAFVDEVTDVFFAYLTRRPARP